MLIKRTFTERLFSLTPWVAFREETEVERTRRIARDTKPSSLDWWPDTQMSEPPPMPPVKPPAPLSPRQREELHQRALQRARRAEVLRNLPLGASETVPSVYSRTGEIQNEQPLYWPLNAVSAPAPEPEPFRTGGGGDFAGGGASGSWEAPAPSCDSSSSDSGCSSDSSSSSSGE